MQKGTDCRESRVAATYHVVTLCLQIIEKGQDQWGIDIRQRQLADRLSVIFLGEVQ